MGSAEQGGARITGGPRVGKPPKAERRAWRHSQGMDRWGSGNQLLHGRPPPTCGTKGPVTFLLCNTLHFTQEETKGLRRGQGTCSRSYKWVQKLRFEPRHRVPSPPTHIATWALTREQHSPTPGSSHSYHLKGQRTQIRQPPTRPQSVHLRGWITALQTSTPSGPEAMTVSL